MLPTLKFNFPGGHPNILFFVTFVTPRYSFYFSRMEKRMLSLIFLAHASDVLENAFAPLNDDDYDVAMKRVRDLLDLDLEAEAAKEKTNEVMWAVFAAFIK